MTKTKLLVITTEGYMAKDQNAEFTARAKDAADKVGAELLVLEPGQHANLFDVCVLPDKAAPGEIKAALRAAGKPATTSVRGMMEHPEATTAQSRDEVDPSAAIQGEAMSFMLNPLEQAIESTTRVMRDELDHMADISRSLQGNVPTTTIYKRMGDHLDALLAAQLKRVTSNDNA